METREEIGEQRIKLDTTLVIHSLLISLDFFWNFLTLRSQTNINIPRYRMYIKRI